MSQGTSGGGVSGTVASIGEKRAVVDHGSGGTSKGKRPAAGSSATAITVGDSDLELHIRSERERRKKMRDMFSNLQALLPQPPPKADKSSIVDEAIKEIKNLQQRLQQLEKQKLERLAAHSKSVTPQCRRPQGAAGLEYTPLMSFQTWSSPNVVLSVSGEDAHISICAAKRAGLFSTMLYVMHKHKLEVVSATISSDSFRIMLMIHARANGVSERFPETLMVEEIYKMAIGEMILWLSSP